MKLYYALWALALPISLQAQQQQDTTQFQLQPVEVNVYFAPQSLMRVTSSTQFIGDKDLNSHQNATFLTAINNVPGLRMEERSPGSYRLAMRGSLIRSPFGIRNTKIYIDEFPITDAGGNTYLNLVDPNGIQSVQVIKGPDGSLFGANSGGVIRIQPKGFDNVNNSISLQLAGGSFGLAQEQLSVQHQVSDTYQFGFNQLFTRSDGYRDHTALNKKSFQTAHSWKYANNANLRLFALYTDLGYQTPGGLTLAQYKENPTASRPAAGPNPSAKEQNAAIYNKTLYAGIANSYALSKEFSHELAVYGSITDFENPFISNYEFRKENNLGVRTYFNLQKTDTNIPWQMQIGMEGSIGHNKIDNFDNDKGTPASVQAKDELNNAVMNLFYRAQIQPLPQWTIEASLGLNKNRITFERLYPLISDSQGNVSPDNKGEISFQAEWMPRIATSYMLNNNFAARASFAKGYSTPTIAEVRSSNNKINQDLQAESGNNYEVGLKWKSTNQRFIIDLAAYQFKMNNGIIRQIDDDGAEFYNNAAKMNQKGIELTSWAHVPIGSSFLRHINYQAGLTYNHYRFENYKVDDKDFSNNRMTAVPDWVWTNSLQFLLASAFDMNISHNYTSTLPLDDANTIFADKYNLLQAKLAWTTTYNKYSFKLYIGADNLLNEKYSLGNDINAFGGRYFNAAPLRNYYAGLIFSL